MIYYTVLYSIIQYYTGTYRINHTNNDNSNRISLLSFLMTAYLSIANHTRTHIYTNDSVDISNWL